jgi:hypothetical protein
MVATAAPAPDNNCFSPSFVSKMDEAFVAKDATNRVDETDLKQARKILNFQRRAAMHNHALPISELP